MPCTQDRETGWFTTVYDDREILNQLDTTTGTGTNTVAEALGCTTTHAYRRLRTLTDEGAVQSQTIGGTRIWTRADGKYGADNGPEDGETA